MFRGQFWASGLYASSPVHDWLLKLTSGCNTYQSLSDQCSSRLASPHTFPSCSGSRTHAHSVALSGDLTNWVIIARILALNHYSFSVHFGFSMAGDTPRPCIKCQSVGRFYFLFIQSTWQVTNNWEEASNSWNKFQDHQVAKYFVGNLLKCTKTRVNSKFE